jgi:hypothetical protein
MRKEERDKRLAKMRRLYEEKGGRVRKLAITLVQRGKPFNQPSRKRESNCVRESARRKFSTANPWFSFTKRKSAPLRKQRES